MRPKSILLAIAAGPMLIGAAQPIRLQPSSPWDVDYAENSCRLIRVFGDADKTKTIFMLESGAPGETDMLVIGKPLVTTDEKVSATFLPMGSKPIQGDPVVYGPAQTPAILWPGVPLLPDDIIAKNDSEQKQRGIKLGVRPPPADPKEEADNREQRHQFATKVEELEIGTKRSHPVILELGLFGEAIRMFDKCSRDSLKSWGVDTDLQDRIARPVWAINSDHWFDSSDYPSDMAARREESQVEIRLLVDATGKITKCTSLSHFKEKEFNQITCALVMRRARFAAAELANGTKVPSYYIRRIIFQMGP